MVFKKIFAQKAEQVAPDNSLVALDIGTEYIKAVIGLVEGDEIEVVGVGRSQQQASAMHAGAIADIASVVKSCEAALNQAEAQAGFQAERVVMGIAGELVKGSTETIRYRRSQPEKVLGEAEMESIINKVQDRSLLKAQQQIALETGNDKVEVKLVNSALVSLHIDGYKVSNPIGFQGRDVAIQIYNAFAPMVHIGALERVADELSLRLIAVSAEPFAVSRSVIGTDASSDFTAILADVGGGTTDVAVVNDGGVEGTKMFGIGGRSFTKTIAKDLNVSSERAEELKLMANNPAAEDDQLYDAKKAILKTLGVWISGIELSLEDFTNVDQLPSQIWLCGGGASLEILVETLTRHEWGKDLPFTKKPLVRRILPSDVAGIKDSTGQITDHTIITALGLLRVGYDTVQDDDEANLSFKEQLNKRLNRILKI